MSFRSVAKRIKYPQRTSDRFKRLDAYDRVREGTFYDHIAIDFDEGDAQSEYIPLRERRPSIIWNGAKMLTDQLSGLLWGDEQMPIVRVAGDDSEAEPEDIAAEKGIQRLTEALTLAAVMDEVTARASSGSAAVVLRAMPDKSLHIEVVPGKEATPIYDPANANRLIGMTQLYPTKGEALKRMGYKIADENLDADYFFRLDISEERETRYVPMTAERYALLGTRGPGGETIRWQIDDERSFDHGWPMLNVLWAKAPMGDRVDGDCLYASIVDMVVEIDYLLSQVARGYKYSADPMLAIRRGELRKGATPAGYDDESKTQKSNGQIVKSPTNVLDIDAGGEAKMLEITGQGLSAAGEYIKQLREWGLEVAGGMKSDADTTSGVQSGRALEMLYQNLILVVKRWRIALGDRVYLPLVRLIYTGIDAGLITVDGVNDGPDPTETLRLTWPTWMTPTGPDLLATVNAWQSLAGGSATVPVPLLPRTAVTRLAASNLGFTDTTSLVQEVEQQNDADKAQQRDDAEHEASLNAKAAPTTPKGK